MQGVIKATTNDINKMSSTFEKFTQSVIMLSSLNDVILPRVTGSVHYNLYYVK